MQRVLYTKKTSPSGAHLMKGFHVQRAQPAEVPPFWRQHGSPHKHKSQSGEAAQIWTGGRDKLGSQLLQAW